MKVMIICGSAQIGKGDVFVNLNTRFYLYACGLEAEEHVHLPLLTVVANPDVKEASDNVRLSTIKTLGFSDKSEYIDSYPHSLETTTAGIWVRVFNESSSKSDLAQYFRWDFMGDVLQIISAPTMSGVTLCTHFKNASYDSLWYCSDWGG